MTFAKAVRLKFGFKKKPSEQLRRREAEEKQLERERLDRAAGRRFTESQEFFEGVERDADARGELDL